MKTNNLPKNWTFLSFDKAFKNVSIKYEVKKKNYLEKGLFPVIDQGSKFIGGFSNIKEAVIRDIPVIAFGDHTRIFKYINFAFIVGCDGLKLYKPVYTESKFSYYMCLALKFPNKGYSRHNQFLKKVLFPIPPLAEQKRIVKKIEDLFADIDMATKNLQQAQDNLIKFRESMLQQAFLGKLYKTTKWGNCTFSNVCNYIQRGKSPKYTDFSSLPVINQKCIRWDELNKKYLKFIDSSQFNGWTKERHVQPMDILWNSTGTGTIGRAYLYLGNEMKDAVVDSHVTIVRANLAKINPKFLFLYIRSPFVQNKIEKMQTGSTNQVELSRTEIQNLSLPLPSLSEQEHIVAKIEEEFKKADILQQKIESALESAKQLKQSILKKAFEGKLVPQDPNDEPASILLEKIKKGKSKNNKTKRKIQ